MTLANDDLFSFSTLTKTFRKRRHLTQQQLAEAIGVHRSAIVRWEQGNYLPESKSMVLDLARYLRLDDQETRHLLEASLTALAPYWLVPLPRNPFFTGREETLEALHTQLGLKQAVTLTQCSALHGLAGIGKTQIALEYAYRYALEYSAIFWIEAETEERILASLVRVASVLQLPGRDDRDQQRVLVAVQRWLSRHGQWLLIWDNLEDLELLNRFLPLSRSGASLITTRCQTLGTLARGIELGPMEREEGVLFLLRRAKILEPEATCEDVRQLAESRATEYVVASELVTAMGGLSLAIDQAGAYLEATRCGLPTYQVLFHTRQAALLTLRGEGAHDHPESVSATFTLALREAVNRHPAVLDLLRVCALLEPDAIPEELFRQGAEHLGAGLETACHDALAWNDVVTDACACSLLHRQPKEHTLSMHRLVQAVLKSTLPHADQRLWRIRVLHAMNQLFPSNERGQADYWQRCERLLSHALLCLTWSEAQVPRVALMNHVATYFSERSRYAEAEALYLRAVCLGEQTLGPDHPQVGEALYGLASLSRRLGKYAEAEALYLRAVCLGEQTLGTDHPQMSEILCGLAGCYRDRGKYAEAEALYQRVLDIQEDTLGPDHPLVAASLQGMAVLYDDLGRYTESEPLYQRVLSIREHALGADHPQVAAVLHNLAEGYREQGWYAQAEPLFLRALHIWEQTLGPDHPRIAHPLHSLAELHREQGQYAQAEPLFLRALHIWEQTLGPEHRLVAVLLNSLALLAQEQGRDAEAETLYLRALSIQERHFDPRHPQTAQTLHDLARLRQKQGNLDEARTLAGRALRIREATLGESHPHTIATRELSAHLGRKQARAEDTAASDNCPEDLLTTRGNERHENEDSPALHQVTTPAPCEHDPLQEFLDACCEMHPRAWCRSAELWQTYERWVEKHQERYPLSRGAFIAQMKAHGCRADRTKSTRIWRGIALVTTDDGR